MRKWIKIIEGVSFSGVSRDQIVSKMTDCILNHRYWDDHAVASYPHLADVDQIHDILDTFANELPKNYDINDPEVAALITRWANARYDKVIYKLDSIPRTNGAYIAHRLIKIAVPFKPIQSLGLYWTYDLDGWNEAVGAYPIWAKDGDTNASILFHALLAPNQIDWTTTILANMDWTSGDNEYELRLISGSEMHVTKAEIYEDDEAGESVNISGVRFTA